MGPDETIQLTELTPVVLESSDGEQTEVKVPCPAASNPSHYPASAATSQPPEDVTATLQNCNDGAESDQSDDVADFFTDNAEYRRLQSLFRGLPKEMFVNRILLNEASCEVKLGEIRSNMFEQLKEVDDFPYGMQCMLKRRVATRNGDSVAVKYAYDIHTLVSILEGGEYSDIREMLSSSKSQRSQSFNSVANVTTNTSCEYATEIKSLTDSMNNLKADVLNMKQKQIGIDQSRSEQISNLKSTVFSLKSDLNELSSTVVRAVTGIRLCAERIESEKSNGVANLKNELRVLKDNLNCMQDVVDGLQCVPLPQASPSQRRRGNKSSKKRKSHDPQYRDTTLSTSVGNSRITDNAGCPVAVDGLQVSNMSEHIFNNQNEQSDFSGQSSGVRHARGEESAIEPTHGSGSSASINVAPCVPSGGANLHYNGTPESIYTEGDTVSADPDVVCLNNSVDQNDVGMNNESNRTPVSVQVTTNGSYRDCVTSCPAIRDPCAGSDQPTGYSIATRITRNVDDEASLTNDIYHISDTDDSDDIEFAQYVKKRAKRYYLGGFKPTITPARIETYVRKRGVKVTWVRIWPSKRNPNNVVIRVNVEDNCNVQLLEKRSFWPRGVICRPWVDHHERSYRQQSQSYSQHTGNNRDTNMVGQTLTIITLTPH